MYHTIKLNEKLFFAALLLARIRQAFQLCIMLWQKSLTLEPYHSDRVLFATITLPRGSGSDIAESLLSIFTQFKWIFHAQ